jgi:hypothetical protein
VDRHEVGEAVMFDCPKTVRVGYADYAVVSMSPEEAAQADHFGITDVNTFEMRIDFATAEPRRVNTVLHELMHACWDAAQLRDTEDEEKAVAGLANVLCQVIRDNPALIVRMVAALAPPDAKATGEHGELRV